MASPVSCRQPCAAACPAVGSAGRRESWRWTARTAFTGRARCDRVGEMAEHPDPAPSSHPLLQDRARLERIKDNMHRHIEYVLHRTRPGDVERVLPGGESTFDVLQEALLALLSTRPGAVATSWEALAVGIAQN